VVEVTAAAEAEVRTVVVAGTDRTKQNRAEKPDRMFRSGSSAFKAIALRWIMPVSAQAASAYFFCFYRATHSFLFSFGRLRWCAQLFLC
jgi:hypothetical protein